MPLRPPPEVLELFTFLVGAHRYAVDLGRVDEVLPEMQGVPAPGAPAFVRGSVVLRGERVPVVELRACLLETAAPEGARPGLLVCWLGPRRVAFAMDAVGAVAQVAVSRLRLPAPAEEAMPGVVAVWEEPPAVHFLLDVLALCAAPSPPAPGRG
ncbi:MAG: chemotaxis protein CheW [Myxococcaceae bacterium]